MVLSTSRGARISSLHRAPQEIDDSDWTTLLNRRTIEFFQDGIARLGITTCASFFLLILRGEIRPLQSTFSVPFALILQTFLAVRLVVILKIWASFLVLLALSLQ